MNKDPEGKELPLLPLPSSSSFVSATAQTAVCLAVTDSPLHKQRENHTREVPWSLAQDLYLSLHIREEGKGKKKQTVKLDQIGKTVMREILT